MELIYEIADFLNVPNERIEINSVVGNIVFFSVFGSRYTCKTWKNGKHLKKNSIVVDKA